MKHDEVVRFRGPLKALGIRHLCAVTLQPLEALAQCRHVGVRCQGQQQDALPVVQHIDVDGALVVGHIGLPIAHGHAHGEPHGSGCIGLDQEGNIHDHGIGGYGQVLAHQFFPIAQDGNACGTTAEMTGLHAG